MGGNFRNHHTVCLTLLSQKFRQSNGFTKEIIKELIWRIFFSERDFLVFPHFKNIRQIDLQYESLVVPIWRNFCKFSNYYTESKETKRLHEIFTMHSF